MADPQEIVADEIEMKEVLDELVRLGVLIYVVENGVVSAVPTLKYQETQCDD